MSFTTQKQVRDGFWQAYPQLGAEARAEGRRSKRQNSQPAGVRCAFVEFVDLLQRDGMMPEKLARNIDLNFTS